MLYDPASDLRSVFRYDGAYSEAIPVRKPSSREFDFAIHFE